MVFQKIFNSSLDAFVAPEVHILHRSPSAFHVCGCLGVAMAVLLTISLVTHMALSPWVMVGLILVAVLTFFALVMATKIVTGHESIIYYHHEIAVMMSSGLALWLLGQPLLPYLDVVILGIGMFLACGRVGCLMVGCCHGRPSSWGVCYRQEHVVAGFTPYLTGIRLFPVQAVESLWVLSIVLVGSNLVLNGQPGEALAWYVITYDLGRFCLEFTRGDPARPYYWSFSQGQWISIILMIVVGWAEWVGALPFYTWHIVVTAALVLAMVFIALRRRCQKTKTHLLLLPHHVKEIADAIEMISPTGSQGAIAETQIDIPQDIQVVRTSLDIQISASGTNGSGDSHHFALSSRSGMMTEEAAEVVANVIVRLKYPSSTIRLGRGNRGVFHVMVESRNGSREVVNQCS